MLQISSGCHNMYRSFTETVSSTGNRIVETKNALIIYNLTSTQFDETAVKELVDIWCQ